MKSQPILRLDKTPATQRPPAADCVDLIYDAESGALKAIDSAGDVPFAGATGSVTASGLVTASGQMTPTQEDSFRASIRGVSDTLDEHDVINNQFNSAHKWGNWSGGVSGQAEPVRFMVIGDSYSIGLGMGPKMGTNGLIGLKTYNATGTVTGHSIPNGNARHDLWIDGSVTQMAVGSTAQFTNGGQATGDVRGSRIGVSYIKQPGGGSFSVQSAPNGTGSNTAGDDTGWTTHGTINTDNATLAADFVEYTVTTSNSPSYRVRIKNVTTAAVFIVHVGVYASNGGGVIPIASGSVGGWDLTGLQSTITSAVFDPLWRFLRPDLIAVCFADSAAEWEAGGNFRWLYDRMIAANSYSLTNAATTAGSTSITHDANTAIRQGMRVAGGTVGISSAVAFITSSTATTLSASAASTQSGLTLTVSQRPDVIIVGGTPVDTGDTTRAAADAAQRAWALETGNTFVSGRALFRSYSHAQATGMMSDNTHLSTVGSRYRNVHLWNRVPIGNLDLGGGGEAAPGSGTGVTNLNFSPVSDSLDRGAAFFNKPLLVSGPTAEFIAADQSSPNTLANRVGFRSVGGEMQLFNAGGIFAYGALSSQIGIHPVGDDACLGGRGGHRWRPFCSGISLRHRATTTDTTFGTGDHTVEITSGSPNITLPAATAQSASTSPSANIAAGIQGKIFILANTGAGTPTIIGTVSGSTNPVVAAQTTWVMQSTGSAWKLLFKVTNAP